MIFNFMFKIFGPLFTIPLGSYCVYRYLILGSSGDGFRLMFLASQVSFLDNFSGILLSPMLTNVTNVLNLVILIIGGHLLVTSPLCLCSLEYIML